MTNEELWERMFVALDIIEDELLDTEGLPPSVVKSLQEASNSLLDAIDFMENSNE